MAERPMEPSDPELMSQLAIGDRTALAELVKRHQDRVFEIAYRFTRNRTLAEDVTQEAFLRLWRSAGRYQPQSQFTTWLYRVVVNLCLDAFKKSRRVSASFLGPDRTHAGDPSTELEHDEMCRTVREAVADLPDRQRMALVLHRFSGLPLADVSRVTGLTDSAVESLLVRAYSTLRKKLESLEKSRDSAAGNRPEARLRIGGSSDVVSKER